MTETWTRVYQVTYWPNPDPSPDLEFVAVCLDVSDDDVGAMNPEHPGAMSDVLSLVDAVMPEVKSINYVGDLDYMTRK